MPNKHFYFALGAANGAVVAYCVRKARRWLFKQFKIVRRLYRLDRDWFLYFPFFIGVMGLIALTPDILHALHVLPKDMTRSGFFNLFYFHSYFEWLEDESASANWVMNITGSVFLFCLALSIFIFYVNQVKNIIRKGSLSKR